MSVDPSQNDTPLHFKITNVETVSSSVDAWLDPDLRSRLTEFGEQRHKDSRTYKPNPRAQQLNRNSRDVDLPQSSIPGYGFIGDNAPLVTLGAAMQQQQPAPIAPGPAVDPNPGGQWSAAGGINSFALVGMDPNFLLGITNFGQFGFMQGPETTPMMSSIGNVAPAKDVVHLSSCTLYPPKPNAPFPTTRERPPGCRTAFVGGLPDRCMEDVIREVFGRCGEISTVRMSKKNFCHIRFVEENAVDSAIYLSGYRLKIGDLEEAANTGRLHVDFAQARDDQYEWECRQRAMQRELRHRERMEQERLRPASPPPVVHYSDHEASLLTEKLREETFQKAAQILIIWLERGELNKRNSGQFYSMIQSTNSHVRRLMNEKQQYEDELNIAKQLLRQRMQGILIQFSQIEKVFTAASHQKVWDHFTKAQRKNLDIWRRQTEETKNAQLEEVLKEREEDEMDLSDDEDDDDSSPAKKQKSGVHQNECLQDDNDLLRCQLEAYRNEVEVLRSEGQQDKEALEKQVKMLKGALTGMQAQLVAATQQSAKDQQELQQMRSQLRDLRDSTTSSSSGDKLSTPQQAASHGGECEPTTCRINNEISSTSAPSKILISEKEAGIIGLVASFLHVHPFGASLEYIWSYLQKLEAGRAVQQPRDLESLLTNFPGLFKQQLSGVGVSLERKWTFTGFTN